MFSSTARRRGIADARNLYDHWLDEHAVDAVEEVFLRIRLLASWHIWQRGARRSIHSRHIGAQY